MSTPTATAPDVLQLAPDVLQLTFEAEIRNPRTFTATDGQNAGKTYYSADAEMATPGARWSTIRIRVRSHAPLVAGRARLHIVTMDGPKGEGVADVVEG